MKQIRIGLFGKILIAIALGVLLGYVLPHWGVRILKTFNVFFAQLLKFIVPLLILGLVTPAISGVGRGAGKMLLTVMLLSYFSTVLAAFFAWGCSSELLPHYIQAGIEAEKNEVVKFLPYFELKIPPICDVLTALALSFMVGTMECFVPMPDNVDREAELKKLQDDLKYTEGFLASVLKKLSNEKFVGGAPAAVIEKERNKQRDAETKIAALREQIAALEK